MNDQVDKKAERERFFGATKVVSSLTFLSRLLGLLRDVVIVPLGSAMVADAFWTAFAIPNMFRRLFGEGALSAAFVPVFTESFERAGLDRARKVLANVAGLLAVILMMLFVLGEVVLLLIWLSSPGTWSRTLLIQLTAVMLPFMITICLLALGSAALNCLGHFVYPPLAPILLNIMLIITALWLAPMLARSDEGQFFIIGVALVLTGVLQVAGIAWLLGKFRLLTMPRIRPILPEVRRIARLMLPMVIPMSAMQIGAVASRFIAWGFTRTVEHPNYPLEPGVVRCIYAAARLYNFPLGILAISIATVVFPLFSRYAARGSEDDFRRAVNRALRLGIFLGIPSGVGLIVLAKPVISLIFQRRNFTSFDTSRAAFILQMYCVGMVAYFCNHILLRAFFARKETRLPLILAVVLSGLNLILIFFGIFTPLRAGVFGAALSFTSTVNTCILLYVLKRRIGTIGGRAILISIVRTAISSAVMAAAIWSAWKLLSLTEPWKVIVISLPVGVVAFFISAVIMRCKELPELFQRASSVSGDDDQSN